MFKLLWSERKASAERILVINLPNGKEFIFTKLRIEIIFASMESANGKSQFVINHPVDEQPELITPEKIKIMDYLFKEVDLERDEDFEELGREFDE